MSINCATSICIHKEMSKLFYLSYIKYISFNTESFITSGFWVKMCYKSILFYNLFYSNFSHLFFVQTIVRKNISFQCIRILLLLLALIGVMNLMLYEYFKTVLQKPFPSILLSFCPALATSFHCFSSKPSTVHGNCSSFCLTQLFKTTEKRLFRL